MNAAKLSTNHKLTGKQIYGIEDADMRVVYSLGQKILPISSGLSKAKDAPIAVIIHYSPLEFKELYPNYNVQVVDSSSHHKTNKSLKLFAYLMQEK